MDYETLLATLGGFVAGLLGSEIRDWIVRSRTKSSLHKAFKAEIASVLEQIEARELKNFLSNATEFDENYGPHFPSELRNFLPSPTVYLTNCHNIGIFHPTYVKNIVIFYTNLDAFNKFIETGKSDIQETHGILISQDRHLFLYNALCQMLDAGQEVCST